MGRRGSLTAGGGGAAGVPEVLLRVADEDQEDQQHGHPAAGAGHFLLRGGWLVLGGLAVDAAAAEHGVRHDLCACDEEAAAPRVHPAEPAEGAHSGLGRAVAGPQVRGAGAEAAQRLLPERGGERVVQRCGS